MNKTLRYLKIRSANQRVQSRRRTRRLKAEVNKEIAEMLNMTKEEMKLNGYS